MNVEPEQLVVVLESISTTLTAFGEKHWADWVAEDARRLRHGDLSGAAHFLSAFGGMGSINDLYICPRNGHRIAETEVVTKNEGLKGALSEAYALAHILVRER